MADPTLLEQAIDGLVSLMDWMGAPGAGIAIALENLFPPIPSEVVLPTAGLAASRGRFTLVEAWLWTTLGSVAGAWVLYLLGAWLGERRVRRIAEVLPLFRAADVDGARAWFDRHGWKAVLFGRMVPMVRSFVSVPAGVARMPAVRFTLCTALGSGLWNAVFLGLGYGLGASWHLIEPYLGVVQWVVVVGLVVLATVWVVRRVREQRTG